MRKVCVAVVAALAVGAAAARASDPVGVYAVIDKVVLEPSSGAPERAQVWGAFSVAKKNTRDDYDGPTRGYVYFALVAGKERQCRAEWADMQKVAGTGECIAFGSRYQPQGTLRKATDKADKPDPHPVAGGLFKVEKKNTEAKKLRALPTPASPGEGDKVEPGEVTLRVKNVHDEEHSGAKYHFEITAAGGEKEASGPIPAGEKETKWAPKMKVKAGVRYTWRVWTAAGTSKGPEATGTFEGKSGQ